MIIEYTEKDYWKDECKNQGTEVFYTDKPDWCSGNEYATIKDAELVGVWFPFKNIGHIYTKRIKGFSKTRRSMKREKV
jgi:hypothetical protein